MIGRYYRVSVMGDRPGVGEVDVAQPARQIVHERHAQAGDIGLSHFLPGERGNVCADRAVVSPAHRLGPGNGRGTRRE